LIHRFPGASKQEIVQAGLIAEKKRIECVRDGKNEVEVLGVDQFIHSLLHPPDLSRPLAFRASPVPAGVVGNGEQATGGAHIDMSAECYGAAMEDGIDRFSLDCGYGILSFICIQT